MQRSLTLLVLAVAVLYIHPWSAHVLAMLGARVSGSAEVAAAADNAGVSGSAEVVAAAVADKAEAATAAAAGNHGISGSPEVAMAADSAGVSGSAERAAQVTAELCAISKLDKGSAAEWPKEAGEIGEVSACPGACRVRL